MAFPTVHFDATGSVVRKPHPTFKRIYFYSAVIQVAEARRIFPIFSMVSAVHDSNTIFKLFNDFRFFCEGHNYWPAFLKIVTDFSFANIHAMCKSLNRCTLPEYLDNCYKCLTDLNNNSCFNNFISIHLCCAHFMKMVSNDVDKLSTNFEQRYYFKDIIAIAIQIYNLENFDEYIKNLAIILNSKKTNKYVTRAMEQLSAVNVIKDKGFPGDLISNDLGVSPDLKGNLDEGLHKGSPFFKRYLEILTNVKDYCKDFGPINIFYNPEMYLLILNKYVPLCPLWTGFFLKQKTRLSNAPAENYFCQVKLNSLESKRNLKCSRFLRVIRKDVLALKIESDLVIPKNRLTKLNDAESEQGSQEQWQKRNKKINTHFEGRFLKKYDNLEGNDDANENTDNYYKNKNLTDECQCFLTNISLSKYERSRLEEMTRAQGKSELWMTERRIRVTSSFFGRICKVKNENSYDNIVKTILYPKEMNVPALKYGSLNEDVARKTYSQKFKINIDNAGLVVHDKYPFIAASPDGFIGKSKIIEIKCPYSIRDLDPNSCDIDFLDRYNTNINKNHNYYYQIQGTLEVTDRQQCDLIIYSKKGLKVVGVERSVEFWLDIKHKLVGFYMNHLLPQIIFPNEILTKEQKKWVTVKPLAFFNNGLVRDINYYRKLKNNREYPITYTRDIKHSLKQINIDDYLSLNDYKELHSFIIDHCLFAFNKSEKYQIISVEKSSIIFGESNILPSFLDSIKFTKPKVAMPFEKGNHYMLVLINFEKNEFVLLDPMGNENAVIDKYFKIIQERIFKLKNININWTMKIENHITQKDSFNCGVYVIYFFHQITNNLSLLDPISNLKAYRDYLKSFLLENSSPMSDLCFYCNDFVENDTHFKCNCCRRLTHNKCILSKKDVDNQITQKDRTMNNICDLCRLN